MRKETSEFGSPFFTIDMPGGITKFHFGKDSIARKWRVWRSDGGHVAWPTLVAANTEAEARQEVAGMIRFFREVVRCGERIWNPATSATHRQGTEQ